MRVFISSTCYDLIDLRAELEAFFREAGVDPILSDSLSSEFQIVPDQNSIETCLVNVRACDEFIIILSNRYGPSLAKAGFDDLSATHLEYNEAVKCKKPIRMFVRDRLEADYNIWRNNRKSPDLKLSWCKEQADWKIFELLAQHRKLANGARGQSNWFWLFGDSIRLKERLAIDFKQAFGRAAVEKLVANGRIPVFELMTRSQGLRGGIVDFSLQLRNIGTVVAVSPLLEVIGAGDKWKFESMAGLEMVTRTIHWAYLGYSFDLTLHLTYSIIDGHKFADIGKLFFKPTQGKPSSVEVSYQLLERKYIGTTAEMLIN